MLFRTYLDYSPRRGAKRAFQGQSVCVNRSTRRQFLGAAAGLAGAAVIYELLSGGPGGSGSPASTTAPLITLDEPIPQQSFITPVSDFFRIDTAYPATPELDASTWRLKVHGMVDSELSLSLEDLTQFDQVSNVITLACVSNEVGGNEIGNAEWGGVLLADVLRAAGVKDGAEQLVSRSQDGWTCGTPVDAVMDGRAAMLVTTMNGEPLTPKHGYPVRMIVPGLFGYVSATKWLTEIELTTWDAFDPYWVVRGWTREGPTIASSRIDVPRPAAKVSSGSLNAGGFAWAPRAGVKQVQVRLDGGEWYEAEVLPGGTGDTWAQWRATIDVPVGDHYLRVRVINADGVVQDEREQPVYPSGATGLHVVKFTAY